MQIFTPEQIRDWDLFTIEHEPISSIHLMERAAERCVQWLEKNDFVSRPFSIFCGKGNNGGDGLAIARLLSTSDIRVTCYILEPGYKGSEDFQANLARLHNTKTDIIFLQSEDQFPVIPKDHVIVDAMFGSGLTRPPEGVVEKLINHINQAGNPVIAIDIPTGMFAGITSAGNAVVKADYTLTFQCYKLAFLMPENERFTGKLVLLDIGLHPEFLNQVNTPLELLQKDFLKVIYQPRQNFAHKGSYGHALLIGGSYGKMGAMQLCARACLRTGVGLVSSFIPECGYDIIQSSVPEAMVITSTERNYIDELPDQWEKYQAIGIGPGLGTEAKTAAVLESLLDKNKEPMVIDADALNLIAKKPVLLKKIAAFSILTPHPKEFERMFGPSPNDFERMKRASAKAVEWQVVIVLKGHFTFIAMPGGKGFFNSTGNAGMATGGSGDVLTGILTSLLAQGYRPAEAALLGVYLHGLAGDYAAAETSKEAMIASDIVEFLGQAFLSLSAKR